MFIQKPNSSKYLISVIAKVVPRRLHLRNEIRFSSQALSLRHPTCGSRPTCGPLSPGSSPPEIL